MRRVPGAVLLVLSLWAASVGVAAPEVANAVVATDCGFGGPTPGWQAIRVDLDEPSDFLTLELGGKRVQRGINDDNNWHLAQGILVLNAQTLALEAWRVDSAGMAPRRVLVASDGSSTANQAVVAPDIPYVHHNAGLRDGLPAGGYYVIAFGSDGGSTLQNEWWSAGVQVEGKHRCTGIGAGATFDIDQTDFGGGTQVYAPGVGMGDELTHSFSTPRRIVVGLIDAETQVRPGSSIELTYDTPTVDGTISQRLMPFVSGAGDYRFEASYRGAYPVVVIAGVAVDLP